MAVYEGAERQIWWRLVGNASAFVFEAPMPFKANADRRDKFPRAKYRVTNWPAYDAALVRQGSLTVWLTDEAIAAWHAPATGKRGGPSRVWGDQAAIASC